MTKLTKRNIDAIEADPAKELWIADDELPGFSLRVTKGGVKSFVARYKRGRTTRAVTVGRYGVLTPDQAREAARQLLAAAKRGEDPARDKREKRESLTFSEVAARYLDDQRHSLRPKSWEHYDALLRLHALPALGTTVAAEVDPRQIKATVRKLGSGAATQNKLLRVLSALFNWAAQAGFVPKGCNPASAAEVKRANEEGRERFLSAEELARLGAALGDDAGDNAIRLLLLTGCRLREILNAKWEAVDFENGVLNLPTSKTGKRSVVLGAAARQLLATMPRDGTHVLGGDRPRADLKGPWRRACKAAGLVGVRLHDLRHSFASSVISGGASIAIVASLLGHASSKTAERYAHLAQSPVRAATDRAGAEIAAKLRAAK